MGHARTISPYRREQTKFATIEDGYVGTRKKFGHPLVWLTKSMAPNFCLGFTVPLDIVLCLPARKKKQLYLLLSFMHRSTADTFYFSLSDDQQIKILSNTAEATNKKNKVILLPSYSVLIKRTKQRNEQTRKQPQK